MLPGVYTTVKKNGEPCYRAGLTIKGKHISLGTYTSEIQASASYTFASLILENNEYSVYNYSETYPLKFEKYIILINLRDNGIYFSNPIYVHKRHFSYFLSPFDELKFDMDDLFFFSQHKIQARGNHYFVSEFGMQTSVRERFGIMPFAVEGRDYFFVNSDSQDFRRENLKIVNNYHGVTIIEKKLSIKYKAVIHIRSNYVIGTFDTIEEAAIAYNKAADILKKNGFDRNFMQNYLDGISALRYAEIYTKIKIPENILRLTPSV